MPKSRLGARCFSNRGRTRAPWNPRVIEASKQTVADIPKYPNRPETIRVSAFRVGDALYADIRVYLRERPTRQGLVIHYDLLPPVLAGLTAASEHLDNATRDLAETSGAGLQGQPVRRR